MTWAGTAATQQRLDGRARDAVTPAAGGAPIVVAEAAVSAGASPQRVIEDIRATPDREGIEGLVGCRGGGHLRLAIDTVLPGLRASADPLYLLLDDLAGSTLISGFVWSRFGGIAGMAEPNPTEDRRGDPLAIRNSMEGVCIGFAPGSTALEMPGSHHVHAVGSLVPADDPDAWHELAELPEISMRRARWIDVTIGDAIEINSGFQDSAGDPVHGRIAVHEYRLRATADLETLTLTSVEADPHVLPFFECPSAPDNIGRMVGVPLADMRGAVLDQLAKTAGCTHLNDALRALAEVPVLVDLLRQNT